MAEITLGTINNTLTQVESNTETTSRGIGSFIDYLKNEIRLRKANGGLISNYKIESRKP